jgi:hypothetical protein
MKRSKLVHLLPVAPWVSCLGHFHNPQGIGIVEGMALVYTSLGVPPAVATTVALADA